jgi:hypothetical protein
MAFFEAHSLPLELAECVCAALTPRAFLRLFLTSQVAYAALTQCSTSSYLNSLYASSHLWRNIVRTHWPQLLCARSSARRARH